jgi:cytidine deaminase
MKLSENQKTLLLMSAREAAKKAHCPHSKFHVGAAVLCTDLTVVTGCNVENASYGLTICAERNAIFATIAQGKRPAAIAVSCPDAAADSPAQYKMPCGACRSVMSEFLGDDATVLVDGVWEFRLDELLPLAFRL